MFRLMSLMIVWMCALVPAALAEEEPVDWDMANKIRAEAFLRSQVMDIMEHLTDVIGPRLTNSPQMKEANEWTRDTLAEWGLENAEVEPWGEFGRGWSFDRCVVHMLTPFKRPLFGLPVAWTPGTNGPVRGEVMKVDIEEEDDFEDYAGKLEGKILLMDDAREYDPDDAAVFDQYDKNELENLEDYPIPGERGPGWRQRAYKRYEFRKKLADFLTEQGAAAVLHVSSRGAGIVRLGGSGAYEVGQNAGPPAITLMSEHYNRLVRLVDMDKKVELEIDVVARFHEDDTTAYNTVAEIRGSRWPREVVMLGGHLDSWHPASGSNDNASGCAVAMEAVRILQALDVKPKRTIRIALWSGEEQGLHGSREYVANHFATRPESDDPEELKKPKRYRKPTWPIKTTKEHERFSAYFNLDNGSGRIRGIYTQSNTAVKPIFEAWLKPFHDLGADTVSTRDTGSTDHTSFDNVGLPGFQFIQDWLDYRSRTHHTNVDHLDHARREDLVQASIIMASFVYHAAMRDDLLPRKPMPQPPPETGDEEEDENDEDDD